jgi:zinc transport system substrate-binding protein
MNKLIRHSLAASATVALLAVPAHAEDGPRVAASIQPIHALVAGVMDGVGMPHLFVGGGDSPHTYAMRPSDAEALSGADAVFWIGPEFEGFLVRPIENLAGEIASVPLIDAPGLVLYDYEEPHDHDHGHSHGEAHGQEHDDDDQHAHAEDDHSHDDGHSHDEGHSHDDGHAHDDDDSHDDGHGHNDEAGHGHGHDHGHDHVHEGTDGHIWLDPANARAMVAHIADALAEIDPANAETYEANAARLTDRLSELEADVAARLEPYAEIPYFTFHEAFRYFDERFGLNSRGAITISPDRQPGAQRLAEIRDEIGAYDHVCVFAEPQFPPSLVDTVTEGTGAGTGVVDPLGAELAEGPELYFELITFNADAFEACFAGT